MTGDLVRNLLSLVGAVTQDGGEAVVRALADVLGEAAPFDQGELVLTLVADLHRRPFGDDGEPLVAEDLIGQLLASGQAVRLDHLSDAAPFPKTRELLTQRRQQSLLALPIARGAVILVARRPCAFAGAPIQSLTPLACAAGIALTLALKLTGLHDEQEGLKEEIRRLREALAATAREAGAREGLLATLRAELDAARQTLDERRIRHEGDVAAAREEAAAFGGEREALRQALEVERAARAAEERRGAETREAVEAAQREHLAQRTRAETLELALAEARAENERRTVEGQTPATAVSPADAAGLVPASPERAEGDPSARRGRRRARA